MLVSDHEPVMTVTNGLRVKTVQSIDYGHELRYSMSICSLLHKCALTPMTLSRETHNFLYKIAQAYYEAGQTQQEIARRYALSRPKVSRLLKQARDQGIVNITLVTPDDDKAALESALEAKYHLEEVLVVKVPDPQDTTGVANQLGPVTAECLMRTMKGDEVVGFAWGRTIRSMVDALPPRTWSGATIVQITGGLGAMGDAEHSTELTRRVAHKFNARLWLLQAPGIVTSPDVARTLLGEPQIARTLTIASQADIAVVGLGVPSQDSVVLRDGSLLTSQDLRKLREVGAVGDVALRYIDTNGKPVSDAINERIVGLSLDQIRDIPRVIGCAGGVEKYAIIRAALRGQLLNVLITDDFTARHLLEESLDDEENK